MRGPSRRISVPLALRCGMLVVVLLGAAITAGGCQPVATPAAQTEIGVTIDDIMADPQHYLGEAVGAQANIARVINEQIVILQSQTSNSQMVAVLSSQAAQSLSTLQAGQAVRLVGTVEPLTREDIQQAEQELGVTLDAGLILSLAGQAPFIVVQDASP
jgi:hypothetical protein